MRPQRLVRFAVRAAVLLINLRLDAVNGHPGSVLFMRLQRNCAAEGSSNAVLVYKAVVVAGVARGEAAAVAGHLFQ